MNILELCRRTYKEYIEQMLDVPPDLRRSLRAHERVPLLIDNLARELTVIQKQPFRLKGKPITKQEIIGIVQDFTRSFVQNVHRQAEERMMSDAAKQAIEENAAKVQEERALAEALVSEETTVNESTTKEGYETSRTTHEIS